MTRARTLVAAGIAASVFLLPGLRAQAPSGIVVSEFRVRGPNGGSDEFVELFNNSTAAIDISGWKIKGSNSAGTVGVRVTIASNTALKAGCYFLATNSSASAGPYSGGLGGGRAYTATLTCADPAGNISTASAVARVSK